MEYSRRKVVPSRGLNVSVARISCISASRRSPNSFSSLLKFASYFSCLSHNRAYRSTNKFSFGVPTDIFAFLGGILPFSRRKELREKYCKITVMIATSTVTYLDGNFRLQPSKYFSRVAVFVGSSRLVQLLYASVVIVRCSCIVHH